MKYWTPRRIQLWIFWALAALYAAARIWHMAAVCLDGDEIFSALIARGDWAKLTSDAARDSVHPPTFYYLVKLWVSLGGESLLWLRALPVLIAVLSLAPLVLLCRELGLRRAEINCVVGVAAIHPLLIFYSQHLRMYSLLLLWATTSLWLFLRVVKWSPPRNDLALRVCALTVANVALVYAHYFGWLVVACEGLYVVLWKRQRFWALAASCAAVFAAFAPWMYVVTRAIVAKGGLSSNLDWIPKPTPGDALWMVAEFLGLGDMPESLRVLAWTLFWAIVVAGIAAVTLRDSHRGARYRRAAGFLAFFAAGPFLIAYAASLLMKNSIWGQRHLIFVAGPLVVLAVLPFLRLHHRAVRVAGLVVLVLWAGLAIEHNISGDDKKTPYDSLVFRVLASEEQTSGPIPFYALDRYVHYPFWFYSNILRAGQNTGIAQDLRAVDRQELARVAQRLAIVDNAKLDDARGAHFWVAYNSKWWRGPRTPAEILAGRNCRSGPPISAGDRFHTLYAVPVWCPDAAGAR